MSIFKRRPIPLLNKPGLAPGQYDHAQRNTLPPVLHTLEYNSQSISESEDQQQLAQPLASDLFRWVHATGPLTLEFLEMLKEKHAFNDLVLEGLVNREQRAKLNTDGDTLFIVLLIPVENEFSQLSIYISGSEIWSFCNRSLPMLGPLRTRLRLQTSKVRQADNLHLGYALIDLVIDQFFEHLEAGGNELERLEADLEENPNRDVLKATHNARALMMLTRKHAWATRDVIAQFQRYIVDLTDPLLERMVQSSYDHAVAIVDLSETYRELATAVIEVHLSIASHRLNETIRVLTIITVLFVPATFIVGIYGMNFDRALPLNMPELGWPFGYVGVLAVIAASMIGMLVFFKRNRWF